MTEMKNNKRKYIFLFLRIAVVAIGICGAMVWLCGNDRWCNLLAVFRQLNLLVFAGVLGIVLFSHIIVGFRWWLLLRTQSIFIDFWAAVRLYFLGWFYNNFMPSSMGGDLIRAWYVTKHTEKRFEAALSVFVDRVIGLLSTLTIAAFFYMVFLHSEGEAITFENKGSRFFGVLSENKKAVFIFIGLVLAFLGVVLSLKPGRRVLKKLEVHVWNRVLKLMRKFKSAVVIYCGKPLAILEVFGLTIFMQLMTISGFWFIGRSLGITAGVKYYYVFFTLTWVLGAVPVSIGGAVVVEGTLAYLFVKFAGVSAEKALALALCQRFLWMLTSLPGAVIHLIGAHLPKDFSIDSEESIN